ncbi:MFS transporter [Streptacidiphilus jiangxiensis]|uniref:Predicted arabinose efflux permease, MFS family n=1 Tax=Streptacidiphilus jiangxiensis TaxID=235985 RepID=A0A1H7UU07_STRJI|nr:MFS transporter [Streptacidiphilus jiangxiensis]SEM00229.1 Predicted arabinose efflux permease, MFS family [Streptacidiphilus jiangxiensis]
MTIRTKAPLPSEFHRIWAASGVSALGDGIYYTALPLLALGLTHDPMVFSTVEACALLPWLFLGLIGGALVDRWDRRRVLWVTDSARFALIGVFALVAAAGGANIAVLCATAFLLGVGQIFFDSASGAYLPTLLGRDPETLQRANSRLQGTGQALEGFVGPPAGGLLFALGRSVPLAVEAATFLFSALMIRSLPPTPAKPRASRTSVLADAREGALYLLRHRLLLGLALRPAVGNFAFLGVGAVLALYVHDTLHLGAALYGVFLTAEAVGGLSGTALAGWLSDRFGTGGTLTLTAAVEAVALLGIGLAPNAVVAGAGFAVLGAAMGATMVLGGSTRQAIVPDELMGRVTAASRLLSRSAGPAGALFGGWLATVAGLRAPFLFGAAVLGVMVVVAARFTSNSRIDAALAEAAAREDAAVPVTV